MEIKLQNTLTGEKDIYNTEGKPDISMYNCGPTVYDYAHIGNFRTFIMNDILRRVFEYNGFKVTQVMNITDVDDKTIKRSQEENVSLKDLTKKYEDLFLKDLESLNILHPHKTPRATENIEEIKEMIQTLLDKGAAYKSSDGIYFDITKSEHYGQLAHLNLENSTKERISNDEYDKANPRDFSLWKFHTEDDGEVSYDAPFGKGRPGWHIECSAMSKKELGDSIDIHTGGQDLIFPHHTNEIAQSECANGHKFVNTWVHGGFITIDGKKMSKSLGNIYTLEILKEKGLSPLGFRYFTLNAHYSTPLNFVLETVKGADSALKKLKANISFFPGGGKIVEERQTEFRKAISDDLNMPNALPILLEVLKDENISDEDKKATILDFDKVLGLGLDQKIAIPENVLMLVTERDAARDEKDFEKSDKLRKEIENLGFEVKDTEKGTVVSPI